MLVVVVVVPSGTLLVRLKSDSEHSSSESAPSLATPAHPRLFSSFL